MKRFNFLFVMCLPFLVMAQGEFIVALNNVDGTFQKINETPLTGIEYLYPNDATIIENTGTYVFASQDASQDIVFVDLATGTIINSPPLNGNRFFETNQDTGILYGLNVGPDFELATPVSIDVTTGAATPLLGTLAATTYAGPFSEINQQHNRMVFFGLPDFTLYYVDLNTGVVLTNTPLQMDAGNAINCIKYHRSNNTFYAQMYDASEQRYYLITINPLTGETEKIGDGYLSASQQMSAAIDLENNTFVTLYSSPILEGFAISTFDIATGAELYSYALSSIDSIDNFYSIEYDANLQQLFALHYDSEILNTEDRDDSLTIALYPNPVSDVLSISVSEKSSYTFYSLQGAEVKSGEIDALSSEIDVSNLAASVYFMEIKTASQTTVKRLIKK